MCYLAVLMGFTIMSLIYLEIVQYEAEYILRPALRHIVLFMDCCFADQGQDVVIVELNGQLNERRNIET